MAPARAMRILIIFGFANTHMNIGSIFRIGWIGGVMLASPVIAQASVAPALPVIPDAVFNITNYGAVGDGVATNSSAIQAAIDAASGKGGGIVEVPQGTFLSGPIRLDSKIELRVDAGATLEMLPFDKYPGGTRMPGTF